MSHPEQNDRYPSTEHLKCDPRMARLLFRSYYDELETISTYIYNSLLLEECCPQTASLFETVAMTEMHHFRLLGSAIRHMGGNPVIRLDLRVPAFDLCPDAPRAKFDTVARQMLRAAINGEQTAAWGYRALADKTRDNALRDLLCRIAADEEEHAKLFQSLGGC